MQNQEQQQTIPDSLKQFANNLLKNGHVYLQTKDKVELYSTKSGESYNFRSEPHLYSQFLKQGKHNRDTWQMLYHDYLSAELPFVAGTIFNPSESALIKNPDGNFKLNTWKPFIPKSVKDPDCNFSLWNEYLGRLFPDEDEKRTCCQWLAHMFQKPTERPSWHLLLTSETGTGKGFLYESVLLPLLSQQAVLLNNFKKLTGEHSTVLEANMLIFLDDAKTSSDFLMTELKSLLTDANQLINPKYLTEKKVKTYSRFIFATNEHRPLRLDDDERRWFIPFRLEHNIDREETAQFIKTLSEWLDAGGLEQVYYWFLDYSLDGFNLKFVKQSETLKSMINNSKSALEGDLQEWLTGKVAFTLNDSCNSLGAPKDLIKKHLIERGYTERYLERTGNRTRYWLLKATPTSEAREYIANSQYA